ncbi:hypothetical protein TREMEDRAFT_58579 [Tremella mesenterica DSM 1558]|uniref:uncharacterized protein n=1 Tax=Tremella mesenterica (strain ATCC 24925 / CBS 8224 / DSM 1558 / NBRC 9311 / NRRL Y-6157 / RJB 2259-6 / UBC 559-6) TaxID=578456 RepID=UPI0003F49D6F|nr:uncharacterized protein TREMEDRAFT_58579 [Tremella mesenterica DSM 1558]EIW72416.1 hypothetical protein TREMEDRAFT_58579 [Tremella mesenterica DSM 1558]
MDLIPDRPLPLVKPDLELHHFEKNSLEVFEGFRTGFGKEASGFWLDRTGLTLDREEIEPIGLEPGSYVNRISQFGRPSLSSLSTLGRSGSTKGHSILKQSESILSTPSTQSALNQPISTSSSPISDQTSTILPPILDHQPTKSDQLSFTVGQNIEQDKMRSRPQLRPQRRTTIPTPNSPQPRPNISRRPTIDNVIHPHNLFPSAPRRSQEEKSPKNERRKKEANTPPSPESPLRDVREIKRSLSSSPESNSSLLVYPASHSIRKNGSQSGVDTDQRNLHTHPSHLQAIHNYAHQQPNTHQSKVYDHNNTHTHHTSTHNHSETYKHQHHNHHSQHVNNHTKPNNVQKTGFDLTPLTQPQSSQNKPTLEEKKPMKTKKRSKIPPVPGRFPPNNKHGEKQCTNCAEIDTPQWRGSLCNACALWKRSRGEDRPLPLLFPRRSPSLSISPPGSPISPTASGISTISNVGINSVSDNRNHVAPIPGGLMPFFSCLSSHKTCRTKSKISYT